MVFVVSHQGHNLDWGRSDFMNPLEKCKEYLTLVQSCHLIRDQVVAAFSMFINALMSATFRRFPAFHRDLNQNDEKGFAWLELSKRILRRPIVCYSSRIKSYFYLSDYGSYIFFDLEDPVENILKPSAGEVVIDIGAHQGRYSMLVAKFVGKDGRVLALEPHPGNFKILKMNIELNRLSNIIPIRIAAYSSGTTLKLFESTSSPWHSVSPELSLALGAKTKGAIEVRGTTVDDLLKELNLKEVDWVKIDVEGAEYEVLRGMTNTLEENSLSLIIEVHTARSGKLVQDYLSAKSYDTEIVGFHTIREELEHYYLYAYRRRENS